MKVLAYLANLSLLGLAAYLGFGKSPQLAEVLWAIGMASFAFLNIFVIATGSSGTDLVSLIVERKRLEQQRKIAELKKDLRGHQ